MTILFAGLGSDVGREHCWFWMFHYDYDYNMVSIPGPM